MSSPPSSPRVLVHLSDLPDDVVPLIAAYLNAIDFCSFRLVSRSIAALCSELIHTLTFADDIAESLLTRVFADNALTAHSDAADDDDASASALHAHAHAHGRFQHVRTLRFSGARVQLASLVHAIPEQWAARVRCVIVEGVHSVTAEAIAALGERFAAATQLHLVSCRTVDDAALVALGASPMAAGLKELHLVDVDVTRLGTALGEKATALRSLVLSENASTEGATLIADLMVHGRPMLASLTSLHVSDSPSMQRGLEKLGEAPGLEKLGEALVSLEVLELGPGVPGVSDEALTAILKALPPLRELALCDLPDVPVSGLAELATRSSRLESLSLSRLQHLDALAVQTLSQATTNLAALDVFDCGVSASDIAGFVRSSARLQVLDLSRLNDFDAALVAAIGACDATLRELYLTASSLDDTLCAELAKYLRGLRVLDVSQCMSLGDSVCALVACNPLLEVLDASWCPGVTASAIELAAAHMGGLKVLQLEGTQCNDAALKAIALRCTALEVFGVGACAAVGDAGLVPVFAANPGLRVVTVSGCESVTDASVLALARPYAPLEELALSECSKVTDAAIVAIARTCPRLEVLDVTQCALLTDASVEALKRHTPRLRTLITLMCDKISGSATDELVDSCTVLPMRQRDTTRIEAIAEEAVQRLTASGAQ